MTISKSSSTYQHYGLGTFPLIIVSIFSIFLATMLSPMFWVAAFFGFMAGFYKPTLWIWLFSLLVIAIAFRFG